MVKLAYKNMIKSFNRYYDLLYKNDCEHLGYDYSKLVDYHDSLMRDNELYNSTACWFNENRHDLLISDRECAAYIMALWENANVD